jgi:septal ring factor EnvC (AmiA/AmiB activator)
MDIPGIIGAVAAGAATLGASAGAGHKLVSLWFQHQERARDQAARLAAEEQIADTEGDRAIREELRRDNAETKAQYARERGEWQARQQRYEEERLERAQREARLAAQGEQLITQCKALATANEELRDQVAQLMAHNEELLTQIRELAAQRAAALDALDAHGIPRPPTRALPAVRPRAKTPVLGAGNTARHRALKPPTNE